MPEVLGWIHKLLTGHNKRRAPKAGERRNLESGGHRDLLRVAVRLGRVVFRKRAWPGRTSCP